MVTVVSTIANDGKKFTPRLVKATVDSKTGERKDIEIVEGEQVISKETSKKVLSMMESVVSEGTGKNARVKGYAVGGKTGTSEDGVNTGKYVTSFVGVADVNDPEVVILILLYNPTGEGGHQGGGIAAPIAAQVLGEVLPYLEVSKSQVDEENSYKNQVEMPDLIGTDISEAKKILKEIGLEAEINQSENSSGIITDQIPKKGIQINAGTKVIIYTD